jgi:hypothetical protein
MRGNAKALKRNNKECKGILIGPLMVPRFFESVKFPQRGFFTHCPSQHVGFGPQILRHGWQTDKLKLTKIPLNALPGRRSQSSGSSSMTWASRPGSNFDPIRDGLRKPQYGATIPSG